MLLDSGFVGIMFVLVSILILQPLFVFGVLIYKKNKNKKFFKVIDDKLYSQIFGNVNIFLSSISIFILIFLYMNYFQNLDKVLDSLFVLAGIISFNILLKVLNIILPHKSQLADVLWNSVLKGFDNLVMVVNLTTASAIIASQIPIVDISKFFGVDVKRVQLIILPFIIMPLFLYWSDVGLVVRSSFVRFKPKLTQYFNESFGTIILLLLSFSIFILFNFSYNILISLIIGILGTYLISKISFYSNCSRLNNKKKFLQNLRFLYPISNILFSTCVAIFILSVVVFTSLNFGSFYGLSMAGIGMVAVLLFKSNLNVNSKDSESYKYLAKTINNLVLFYVFFENLEFIFNKQMNINIFSHNVIIGLFLSIILVVFNLFKIVNLVKYTELNKKAKYLLFRSGVYVVLFVSCIYIFLPYINYEVLGAFVLGLILITAFLSLLSLNTVDVMEVMFPTQKGVGQLFRNTVVPLLNQITVLFIIITMLF